MDYGIAQGLERATGNLAATGMKLMEFQANKQLAADKMDIANRELNMKEQAFKYEKEKLDKAKKEDEAFIPVSSLLPQWANNPSLKKLHIDAARSAGYDVKETGDEVYAPMGAIKFVGKLISTDTEFAKKNIEATMTDLTAQSTAISNQILALQNEGKGEDKSIPALQQKLLNIKNSIATMITTDMDFQKKLALENAKKTITSDMVPYRDPTGATVLINEKDPNSQIIINEKKLVPSANYKSENSATPHTTVETSPDGTKERTIIWDANTKGYKPLEGAGGGWHPVKSQVTNINMSGKDKEIDVPSLAQGIIDGNDAPAAIRGSMGNPLAAKVKTEVYKKYPKFNMAMSDANYKWKQSSTNQRTINFAGGALPRLGALDDQLAKLPNTTIPKINEIIRVVSKEFGKPEYTNFESNRNAIVQEVNTALSGTSQGSDMRIKIELENLKGANSPAQIAGSIHNLRAALEARMDVDLSPLYPIEVVRGEKTMEVYKKELFEKYRNNYGTGSKGKGKSDPLDAFWK